MGENEIYIELSLRMRYVVIFGRLKYYYINASYNKRKTSPQRSGYAYPQVPDKYQEFINLFKFHYYPISFDMRFEKHRRIGYGYRRDGEVSVTP